MQKQSGKSYVSEGAVFVCNKWDLLKDKEKGEIADYIKSKLKLNWPGLDCQSQVVELSTTNAIEAQNFGMISPQFRMFIDLVKSMMVRAIHSRLEIECR